MRVLADCLSFLEKGQDFIKVNALDTRRTETLPCEFNVRKYLSQRLGRHSTLYLSLNISFGNVKLKTYSHSIVAVLQSLM